MKILIAPHNFEIGGSQINAIELAQAVAQLPDHEVIMYAPDGELTAMARDRGLDLRLGRLHERAPWFPRIREIRAIVRAEGIDLVHAYEWNVTIDAALGASAALGVPVLSTILSMDYAWYLPRVPVVLGTRELFHQARDEGREAYLIEPPVDTELFSPEATLSAEVLRTREECGVGPGQQLIVVVGRLSAHLKLDGLLSLIAAVGELAQHRDVRLAVIGDGPARSQVEQAATDTNRLVGRSVIGVLGARSEPRRFYAAADVVVGMGSSALRAMALGKPLVVQGEKGFWLVADEKSLPTFLSQGWYGIGDGEHSVERCRRALDRLLDSSDERQRLGAFGRSVVVDHYSLSTAAQTLVEIYQQVVSRPPQPQQRALTPLRLLKEMSQQRVIMSAKSAAQRWRAARSR